MCTNLVVRKFHITSPATFGLFFCAVLPSFDAHHRFSYQHHSFKKRMKIMTAFSLLFQHPRSPTRPDQAQQGGLGTTQPVCMVSLLAAKVRTGQLSCLCAQQQGLQTLFRTCIQRMQCLEKMRTARHDGTHSESDFFRNSPALT